MDERNLFDWQSGDLIEEGKMNLINKSIRDIWIQLDELSTETGEISIEALQVKYEVEHNNSLYFNVQDFLDYVSGKLLNLDKKDIELLETIKNKKVSVDEIEYKTETYVTLKDFLDSIQAILQEMSDEMDLTVETVNDMNEKVIDVTEGFNEVETEVISVKNSIKLVNSTIDLIKADIEALQNKKIDISEISYVNGTYITLKSFLDYVGSKLNSLDSKDTELNNAITVLRNAITTLQNKKYNATDIAFTHETYTTVDTFVRYLERTLDDIGTDVEGIKETLETIEEELDIDVYTIKYTKRDCITLGNYLDFIDVTIDDLYDNIDTINLDLDTKVDKEEGKSLISDTEIERLSNVNNYDDTEVKGLITNLQNTKVDKEEGKSLIDDDEISRLANVDNYDDTEVRGLINAKANPSDIPTKTSQLTNDSGYLTEHQDISHLVTQDEFDELELIETSATEPTDEDVVIWINTSQDDNLADILARINDDTVASNTTWSSEKIEDMITNIGNIEIDGSAIDLSEYAKKTELHEHSNKSVIDTITSDMFNKWNKAIPFEDSYIDNCNNWLTNGYTKTSTSTSNLPSLCTGADKWGVLFYIAENPNGTGTQMYFPIDGTYVGRVFVRSMKARNPNGNWTVLSTFSGDYNDLINKPTSIGNASTVNGYALWVGTQSEYEAIATKDENTIYMIKE